MAFWLPNQRAASNDLLLEVYDAFEKPSSLEIRIIVNNAHDSHWSRCSDRTKFAFALIPSFTGAEIGIGNSYQWLILQFQMITVFKTNQLNFADGPRKQANKVERKDIVKTYRAIARLVDWLTNVRTSWPYSFALDRFALSNQASQIHWWLLLVVPIQRRKQLVLNWSCA